MQIINRLNDNIHFFLIKYLVIIINNLTFADDGNCLNSNHLYPEDTLFIVMGLVFYICKDFPFHLFSPNVAKVGLNVTD